MGLDFSYIPWFNFWLFRNVGRVYVDIAWSFDLEQAGYLSVCVYLCMLSSTKVAV